MAAFQGLARDGWLLFWTAILYILMTHLTHHKPTRWGLVIQDGILT